MAKSLSLSIHGRRATTATGVNASSRLPCPRPVWEYCTAVLALVLSMAKAASCGDIGDVGGCRLLAGDLGCSGNSSVPLGDNVESRKTGHAQRGLACDGGGSSTALLVLHRFDRVHRWRYRWIKYVRPWSEVNIGSANLEQWLAVAHVAQSGGRTEREDSLCMSLGLRTFPQQDCFF